MSLESAFLFVFHFTSSVTLKTICHAAPHQHQSVLEYLTPVPLTPFTDMCGRGRLSTDSCGSGRKICGRQSVCVRTSLADDTRMCVLE